MVNYLLFDISNMLYRTFFVNKGQSDDDIETAGYAHHIALTTLNKYFKQFRPRKKVVMVYDRPSWRKDYTKSDQCYSGRIYKGGRRKNMTPKEKERYIKFMNHISEFEDMMRRQTSVVCLAGDKLEADDLVAGFVQKYAEDEIILVSTDKDFLQLKRHPKLKIISPENGKERTLDEWDGDPDLFMFEKCFRGEGPTQDNVQNAYPGLRTKKIREAYKDPFVKVNIMNEFWVAPDGKEFLVKRLWEENKLLMDLTCQPDWVRELINHTIDYEMANSGKYSYFEFLKFCGKYDLKKITQQAELFIPMLSR